MALLEINASTLTTAVLATVVLLLLHRLHQAWVERKRVTAEEPSIPRALKRKMSNIGVSTLVSETETNLSIPVSLLTLEGDVSIDEITARLQERMGTDAFFIRFRSRVVGEQRTFIEQPDFDASNHVKSHVLREGETPTSYLESIVNKPLDFSKPLWEMHVVHTPTKTETHLCWKVHHCIGDGQSLAVALIRLSDNKEQFEKMIDKLQAAKKSEKKAPKPFATKAKESAGFLMLCVWSWLVIVRKLGVLIFRTEPATIFKRVGGTQKKLSHQMLYSVSETKRVGKHFNATINDVMLSCIAGAMRKSLQSTGVPVSPKLVLRAAIPVDMRGTNEVVDSARNKFSALVIDFPVGLDDPKKRLKIVRGNMNEAKNSLEKVFTYLSSQIVSRLPDWLMKPVIQFTTSKLSVAISNVRAAAFSLSVCGKPLKGSFGFVPPPPTVNLGVAILSVGDELGLNVLVDPAVGIDGKQFLVYAMDEFKALLAIADAATTTTAEAKKTQ